MIQYCCFVAIKKCFCFCHDLFFGKRKYINFFLEIANFVMKCMWLLHCALYVIMSHVTSRHICKSIN